MVIRCLIAILAACLLSGSALATDISEVSAATLMQQGLAAYQRGDYPNAIRHLSARARMAPADANVYYYLGHCYCQTKQTDQAAHMYSACIRLNPTSQAGQYALKALETLSTMPKVPPETKLEPLAVDPEASTATKDGLMTTAAIDKQFNDAAQRIKSQRQTLKARIDRAWEQVQDEMTAMNPRSTQNYSQEMERLRRDTEIKVENMHLKELRMESRMLAPDKVDVRAVPKLPEEKRDDTKTSLGSLLEYFTPEQPFDPFATELTPEIVSKFMSIKDVFGELSTYQPAARAVAKQCFMQMKRGVETKQDYFDQQIFQAKSNLIKDIISIKISYGNSQTFRNQQPSYHLSKTKIPRADQTHLSPMEQEVSQVTERAKKRIKELQENYDKDIDLLVTGAKERLSGLVAQTGNMNKQLKNVKGTIQIIPLGTSVYTRNYVNFGDRTEPVSQQKVDATPMVKPLSATAQSFKGPLKKSSTGKSK